MNRVSVKRVLSLLLAAVMLLALYGPCTVARAAQGQAYYGAPVVKTNPVCCSTPELDAGEAVAAQAETVYQAKSVADAVAFLRRQVKEHKTDVAVSIPVDTPFDIANQAAFWDAFYTLEEEIYQAVVAHTGDADEGDYLHYSKIYGREVDPTLWSNDLAHVETHYRFIYHTTQQQEAAVEAAVEKLLEQWDLEDATDYEKVRTVYDWLCSNVTYAKTIPMENSTVYSAYGALVEKECVCQGYASAMYRLLLELDVDCRVLRGIGNGGPHSWNIIKLGHCYYNADATWDAACFQAGVEYQNFLKNEANFPDHLRDMQYSTESFYAAYPMGEEDYDPANAPADDPTDDPADNPTEQPLAEIVGTSVSLGDSLDIHFFLDRDDVESTDYAVVTRRYADGREDHVATVPYSQWTVLDEDLIYITYGDIAAKEMGDDITVVIYDAEGNAVSEIYTDSIQAYAMRMLEDREDPELLTLLVDMLNYGAEAQIHFGYDAENPVNGALTQTQKDYATDSCETESDLSFSDGRVATALTLKSRIKLDLFFSSSVLGAELADLYAVAVYTDHYGDTWEIWVAGEEFRVADGDSVYVSIPVLSVADYAQGVTCTVYDAEGNVLAWATDSIQGYAHRMRGSLPAIVESIVKFGAAAYRYFH